MPFQAQYRFDFHNKIQSSFPYISTSTHYWTAYTHTGFVHIWGAQLFKGHRTSMWLVTAVELYNNAYILLRLAPQPKHVCFHSSFHLSGFSYEKVFFVFMQFIKKNELHDKKKKKKHLKSRGKGPEMTAATCFSSNMKLMFKILNKPLEFNTASSQLRSSWSWGETPFVQARELQESNCIE